MTSDVTRILLSVCVLTGLFIFVSTFEIPVTTSDAQLQTNYWEPGTVAPNSIQTRAGAGIRLKAAGNFPISSSTGGLMNLDNTANTSEGLVIYSNRDSSAQGHLLSVRADHSAFGRSAIYATYDGISHLANFVNRGSGGANAALNITSSNRLYSAVTISGEELNHGTVKISHTGNGTDANSAALSLDLKGAGTASQGIYINSTEGGTTGDLLDLRNNNQQQFVVDSTGVMSLISECFEMMKGSTRYRISINSAGTGLLITPGICPR